MLFRLHTTDHSLAVKRSITDSPVAPLAIAVSLAVASVGAYGLKQAGHGPAATVALPIGFFLAATLLFLAEDRRRARNLAREGSLFDRKGGRFIQDGHDVCALADLARVRLLQTADCNGSIFGVEVVNRDGASYELVGTYAAAGDEKPALQELGRRIAEFCGLPYAEEVDMKQVSR
jgi:hypothetical protein